VNRRVQGDIGEASAIEWLTCNGALVWVPMGHSPDVDLMAEFEERLVRVQVKTSTQLVGPTSDTGQRWKVAIATRGGNQSWSGVTKQFDPRSTDYLFVLTGNGRRWFIPAHCVEANSEVTLGGTKYSEFEVEAGIAFEGLVYGDPSANRIRHPFLGECQSGQMDVTVNHTAMPTQVRILPPPSPASVQIVLRPKRQATIPLRPCDEAGLAPGDRLRVSADGPGRVLLERIERETAEPASGSGLTAVAPRPDARSSAR
jgi:hypothetical protein